MAAAAPVNSQSLIHIGTRVQVRGIQAKPYLNGQRGVVMKFVTSSSRYLVRMDNGVRSFNFKLENLEPSSCEDGEFAANISSGSRVEVRGIQAKPHLNGQQGIVKKFVAPSRRYMVRMDGEQICFKFKPDNLTMIAFGSYALSFDGLTSKFIHDGFDNGLLDSLVMIARCNQTAEEDVRYWDGHLQPWRKGTDHTAITDLAIIEREEKYKVAAEADDKARAPTPGAHADMLHRRGVSASFLVLLTHKCNLWEWKTWEVVQFFVKPATEQLTHGQRRCFADIPGLETFTGPATVFASHCWGGRWGDLVAALCAGASTRRVVWIDVFAVRQWPGNGADLDFRGVIERSAATMVAVVPPVDGPLMERGLMNNDAERDAYLGGRIGDFYARDSQVLPFCRLWCLAEMFATLQSAKPLILRGAQVKSIGKDGVAVTGHSSSYSGSSSSSSSSDSGSDSGSGCGEDEQEETSTRHRALMIHVLDNCSKIVDVRRAQCGVEADRGREMKAIEQEAADQGGLPFVNKSLEAAITRGMISVQEGIMEVDNFLCGEPEGLRKLPLERVEGAVFTVCAAGLVEVLDELLDAGDAQEEEEEEEEEEERGGRGSGGHGSEGGAMGMEVQRLVSNHFYPLYIAAANGHTSIVERLLRVEGVDVNRGHVDNGTTPLLIACSKEHKTVVERLLAHDAIDVNRAETENGATPLSVACDKNYEAITEMLLAHEAIDVNKATTNNGTTPLFLACLNNHGAVVERLLAHSAIDVNQAETDNGFTPLFAACYQNHDAVVERLLAHDAIDVNRAETENGATPLLVACGLNHETVVEMLLAHKSINVNQARTTDGTTPLFAACYQNHKVVVDRLLTHGTINVNQATKDASASPLYIACQNNHEVVVERLLAHDEVNVNQASTKDGMTPLFIACQNNHRAVVERLLAHDAIDVNQARASDGFTPLFAACCQNHEAVVEQLLAQDSIDANQTTTSDGTTPLYAACLCGHGGIVHRLLEKGGDTSITMRDYYGWSPLFVASWGGYADVVKDLLAHSADPTIKTTSEHLQVPAGSTALSVAEHKGHIGVIGVLTAGADNAT